MKGNSASSKNQMQVVSQRDSQHLAATPMLQSSHATPASQTLYPRQQKPFAPEYQQTR